MAGEPPVIPVGLGRNSLSRLLLRDGAAGLVATPKTKQPWWQRHKVAVWDGLGARRKRSAEIFRL